MSTDPRIRWQRTVAAAEELPRSVRHIAVLMGCHLNAQLVGGVALAVLMAQSGYSKPTVLRATKRLRAGGWLRVVTPHRRGRATVYQADVPAALWDRDEVSAEAPHGLDEVSPVTPDGAGGAVDRRFEVSPVTPDRPLGVSAVTPQPANEVSPGTPLFKDKELPRRDPVDDGGAARPPARAADVETVMAALCPDMSPRSEEEAVSFRHLIRQRLEHRSLVDLVRETAHLRPSGPVRSPAGLYAVKVPVVPAAVLPPAQPAPRCTKYGHEHAPVTSRGCSACLVDAVAAS